jgi:S-adenosylmethionine uptake transporter
MIQGILLGFLAYGLFAFSDAAVKAIGGRLSVFEIGFFAGLFACAVLPAMRGGESWRNAFTPKRPGLVAIRAISGTLAGLLGFFSFTHLPFAEAYAIIFLAPGFVTIFSVLLLREHVGWPRWVAIAIGLAGVLLVVRPGFEAVVPAHLAAVGTAICTATTVLVLRTLGPVERRASILGYALILSTVFNAVAMIPGFRWPSGGDFFFMAACGLLSAAAQLCLMVATRFAAANRVAPTQYSQMIWAVLIGAVFFAEIPDHLALAGIGLILLSGVLIFMRPKPPAVTPGPITRGPTV